MLTRAFSRAKPQFLAPLTFQHLIETVPISQPSTPLSLNPKTASVKPDSCKPTNGFFLICRRQYHDGRPRGPLWRGKKLIGKEALFVILGLKRIQDDEEKLAQFIKKHVLRLLKLDLIAVLTELERQEEVALALKVSISFCFLFIDFEFVSTL